jgi:Trypsin-like peptidase domain
LIPHQIAMPVLAIRDGPLAGEGLYGTAFPIGGRLVLTADHVVSNAQAAGKIAVGIFGVVVGTQAGISVHAEAVVAARWPDLDLAALDLFEAGEPFAPLRWSTDEVGMLTQIFATGYALGYSRTENALFIRSFSGTVVAGYQTSRIVKRTLPANPRIYETSFLALPGLSGAALVARGNVVVGCIIGSSQSFTTLESWQEHRTNEEGGLTTVEVRESYSPGIAIQSKEILALSFGDGSTVRDRIIAAGGQVGVKIPRLVTT